MRIITSLILIGLLWYMGAKPIIAEYYFTQFNKFGAIQEKNILRAVKFDPCSQHTFHAGRFYLKKDPIKASRYLDDTIRNFNGDLTLWSIWFYKGLNDYSQGRLLEARADFERCLYYWPGFTPAKENLSGVSEIISKNDKVLIRIR